MKRGKTMSEHDQPSIAPGNTGEQPPKADDSAFVRFGVLSNCPPDFPGNRRSDYDQLHYTAFNAV